jgi:hypothetical protein
MFLRLRFSHLPKTASDTTDVLFATRKVGYSIRHDFAFMPDLAFQNVAEQK